MYTALTYDVMKSSLIRVRDKKNCNGFITLETRVYCDKSRKYILGTFNSAEIHLFRILSTAPQRALCKDAFLQLKIVGISMRDSVVRCVSESNS